MDRKSRLKHVLLIVTMIAFFTSSVSFLSADQNDKPVIEIKFFYDNPCADCHTVSDFQKVVSEAGKSLWDDVTYRVLPTPAYTAAGNRELQEILDEFEITGPDRSHSEIVLIGDTLLTGTDMIENELGDVLALRAEALLAEVEIISLMPLLKLPLTVNVKRSEAEALITTSELMARLKDSQLKVVIK